MAEISARTSLPKKACPAGMSDCLLKTQSFKKVECIVLAGGLGTRLQSVIGSIPKCMAPVAGKPFLYHLLHYLAGQGCTRIVLSLGYKHEIVTQWLSGQEWPFEIDSVVETEPLGPGGGIGLAMQRALSENIFIINGDTMFRTDLTAMNHFHQEKKSATTLALKGMLDFDRYGAVHCTEDGLILSFEEKKQVREGLINGGIYLVNKTFFTQKQLPYKCSFEKDYLEKFITEQQFYGYTSDAYFIDIGIPADYEKAQKDLLL